MEECLLPRWRAVSYFTRLYRSVLELTSPNCSEWIMEYLATWLATIYNNLVVIPKWLLYVITGAAGSVVIGLLHRSPKKPAAPKSKPLPAKKDELPARVGSPLSAQSSTGSTMTTRSSSPKTTTTKKGGAKSKKTGKK